MCQLISTTKFKKDLKELKSDKQNFELVGKVLKSLQNKGVRGIKVAMSNINHEQHKLKGNYADNWECHIKPDMLIIWVQIESPKELLTWNCSGKWM